MKSVVEGNLAAQAAAFLMTLAYVRDVHGVLENPHGSRMFAMFQVASVLVFDTFRTACMRCPFAVEPDGQRHWKRYMFLSASMWVKRLRRKCGCLSKQHIKLTKKRFGRVSGIKPRLRESAAYPLALGSAVISAWEAGPEPGSSIQKKRHRQLLRQASTATSISHGLLCDHIDEAGLSASQDRHHKELRRTVSTSSSNSGGLLFEGAAELGLSSSVQSMSGLNGAGFSAPSPDLCCKSSADSEDVGCLGSPSPILLASDDDVGDHQSTAIEESFLHCGSTSDSDIMME